MKLLKTKDGVILEIQVKPKSKNFRIRVNDELVIFCRQQPVKGKVNRELIKELSKIFERKIEIVSGLRSKVKKILIRKIAEEDVFKALESVRRDSIV